MCLLQNVHVEFLSREKMQGTTENKKDSECLLKLTRSPNTLYFSVTVLEH